MQSKSVFLIAALFVGLCVALWASNLDDKTPPRPAFGHANVTLTRTDGTRFPFKMEVARSEEEQAYGLMYVKKMRDDEGMVFLFPEPKQALFWMKNTHIPLDMLFVRPDGTIGSIAADRQPEDITPVSSEGLTGSVVEINAGLAKKYGLEAGNKVEIK